MSDEADKSMFTDTVDPALRYQLLQNGINPWKTSRCLKQDPQHDTKVVTKSVATVLFSL